MRFLLRINHEYFPMKSQKISTPGKIQDRVNPAHVPEIKDFPGKSKTDDQF